MLTDKCTDKCAEHVVHCFGILFKLLLLLLDYGKGASKWDNLSQTGNRIHSFRCTRRNGCRTTGRWVSTSILHFYRYKEFCFLQVPSNKSQVDNDLHYASVHFTKNQSDPVYSNVGPSAFSRSDEEDEESTDYSLVKCDIRIPSPR